MTTVTNPPIQDPQKVNSNYQMRKFFNYIFLIHFLLELNGQTLSNQSSKLNVVLFMVDDLKPGIYNDSFQ